jgi:hypothetical protein
MINIYHPEQQSKGQKSGKRTKGNGGGLQKVWNRTFLE